MPRCKCGKQITYGVTLQGETLALEVMKHVYSGVHSEYPTGPGPFPVMPPPIACYLAHFVTCPDMPRNQKRIAPVEETTYHDKKEK